MPSTTYYQKRPIMEAEFKAGFVVYDSSYPTDIEARRELKYCQGYCGRLFVAHYKVVTDDATGEKKISVDLVCTACASKLDSGQTKEFPLSVKEEKELLADHLPEGGERHPKSGFAAHVPEPRVNAAFVGQKGVRWSKWRIPLAKAFKEKGKLTSAEIGTILGCLGPQAVSRVRRSGIILNVVGKIKTPGRKSRVLYSVANETRVFTT